MQLLEIYQQRIQAEQLNEDPAQHDVLVILQAVVDQLANQPKSRGWKSLFAAKPDSIKGLYLWGGVGRGKTWLMDLFFDSLPSEKKQRLHFHRFMKEVHAYLADIRAQKDPLKLVAKKFAEKSRLICLDEFHVVDIGDAVILAGLLRALFDEGVVLITTSNAHPDDLYKDGIQRASFLPAIELLKQHTQVTRMGGERDYRREILDRAEVYYTPLSEQADESMKTEFHQIATTHVEQDGELLINTRVMLYRYYSEGVVWFDFMALCGPPRSQHDYIELARTHHTVFISDVPAMGAIRDDVARRFIFLIDEFYDRKVKVIISAEATPMKLYMGERLAFEFQRTVSRLNEMRTETYLGSEHRS